MGVPCTPISTVDVAAGDGISISFVGGVYTVSLDTDVLSAISNYKVYASEAARDTDNPSPSSGDAAWAQDIDTLWYHDGTDWIIMREPEQTYTPTYTNVTLGSSPTREGFYRRSNGMINLATRLVLGTGGALTGQPTISLPSGITLAAISRGIAAAHIIDGVAATYHGVVLNGVAAAAFITVGVSNSSGTYVTHDALSATVPMTWTSTDELRTAAAWFPMNTMYL